MATVTRWSTAELEVLAGVVLCQDQGVLQHQYNQRASQALLDFAKSLSHRLVTHAMAYKACKVGRLTRDEPSVEEIALMRRKLEAALSEKYHES